MAINDLLQAVMVCEGAEEATEEFQLECWQYLVDTGAVHVLQGSFGRKAEQLIAAGLISKPTKGSR